MDLVSQESQSTDPEFDVEPPPLTEVEWDLLYERHMAGEVLSDYERQRFERSTFGI